MRTSYLLDALLNQWKLERPIIHFMTKVLFDYRFAYQAVWIASSFVSDERDNLIASFNFWIAGFKSI